jgi:hypothetical protein
MTNDGEGEKAISALNGTLLGGRALNVNEARPRPAKREPRRQQGRGGYRQYRNY